MNPNETRNQPYALKAGDGWTYRFGIDFTVKLGELNGGCGVALVEYNTLQGEEPPRHTHQTEDEIFYVLEGAVSFQCGSQTFDIEKGGFIFLPHSIEHSYSIRNQKSVRLLVITAPVREHASGGWGGFVSDLESGQGELIAKPSHKS
ncbi:MAG: hypothetical protein A2Y88_12580 [Chloroflexi bacterium RBG_13_48_10]|nr:MAG: hypothetical protein A2Y88_12580 [Chloroflexi bacterium RBG_13_48_10]